MNNTFLLFAGFRGEAPQGGWNDLEGKYSSLEAALSAIKALEFCVSYTIVDGISLREIARNKWRSLDPDFTAECSFSEYIRGTDVQATESEQITEKLNFLAERFKNEASVLNIINKSLDADYANLFQVLLLLKGANIQFFKPS